MTLYCINNTFHYEAENLLRVFLPFEKITVEAKLPEGEPCSDYAVLNTDTNGGYSEVTVSIGGKKLTKSHLPLESDNDDDREREACKLLFFELSEIFNRRPPWGILTGVRPSKLMMRLSENMGEERAREYFTDRLCVMPEKTALASRVAVQEKRLIDSLTPDSACLYIAIPFCPTRCSYCSFVSHSVDTPAAKKLVPAYVELLCREIEAAGEAVRETGMRVEYVYWGGGTPTTLEAEQLDIIMQAIENSFDTSAFREYTVEAGRPDTITRAKLEVLKKHDTGRLSVNPQSFSDNVLRAIGRRHTSQETTQAFLLAQECGFDNINMDFIAGLPEDTVNGFADSVARAIELGAQSITIHTLALKRASSLVSSGAAENSTGASDTAQMLARASQMLDNAGYTPYYMYRQSKTSGNLENTGWCKPGYECIYNIVMMEECRNVIGVGAGAVTKLCKGTDVRRIFNFKYPYEYITGFDEIIKRKNSISGLYRDIQ